MNTTLLYQMGKVGSTSIDYALNKKGIRTLHAHWMMGEFPDSEFPTQKLELAEKILAGNTPPLKVIVPIREPFGRNLSAFTFNLIKYGVTGRQESVEELKELFLKEYTHTYPQRWFEKELLTLFDFDPFSIPFNHKRGFQVYPAGKHEILIVRLEDANRIFSKAIRKFLGVRGVRMVHNNSLEDKKYIGNKYKELKIQKYPKWVLRKTYNLKYAKHFYTEKEVEKLKQFWMGNGI